MEPAPQPLKLKINYVIYARVTKLEWNNNPDGWFVNFKGSWESLNFGIEHPQFDKDDTVKITFEKVDPCPPSQTTNPTT